MDVFTILNDLVLLGLVGIILTIFRKSDKMSKSLEQVKKYATKRNDEFDQYVEDRIIYLKDLSISLDVQEKTGKIILDNIVKEKIELSAKLEQIEDSNKKVQSYGSTMEKMLNLSQELDNRYSKLQKDSTYLETVDKKLRDSGKKLNVIEKNIGTITSEFIKNNNVSINKLKDNLFNKTEKDIIDFDNRIAKTSTEIERLEEFVNKIQTSYQDGAVTELNRFKEIISNMSKEGQKLEESSFAELLTRIDLRQNELLTTLDDKIEFTESNYSKKIEQIVMDMGNIEAISNKIKDENEARLSSIKNQLNNQLQALKNMNSQGIAGLHEEFNTMFTEFKDNSITMITDAQNSSKKLIDKIDEQFSRVTEQQQKVRDKIASTEEYVEQEVLDLKDRIDGTTYNITREIDIKEESIKLKAFKHLEDNLSNYREEVDGKLKELSGVTTIIDEIKGDIYEDLADSKKNITNEIYNIKIDLSSEIEKISNVHKDSLVSLTNDWKEYEKRSEKAKENQELLLKELKDGETEIRAKVNNRNDLFIKEIRADIESKLSDFGIQFKEKINSLGAFENEIKAVKAELESILQNQEDSFSEQYRLFQEEQLNRMGSDRKELQMFIEKFNNEKDNLENDIITLKNSTYTNISEKLDLFQDDYFSKLREKEEFIQLETDKWKNVLTESVSKIRDESEESILKSMEGVHQKFNTFKNTLLSDLSDFEDQTGARLNTFVSEYQQEENKINKDREEFKKKATEDLIDLEEKLLTLHSQINSSSETLKKSLSEISEEQAHYIKESEIFTRTDILRQELSDAIVQLKDNLNSANERSGFIEITNQKLNNVKILAESVNEQINSIETQGANIDKLESRVSKVLDLSRGVEEQIKRIKESESDVVAIQLKLRNLKELESEVALEFSRLETKEEILAETNRGIDNGFSSLQVIEHKIDGLKENVIPFNNQIDNIKDKLRRIEEREGRVNQAIGFLSSLDDSITQIEERITKMDKAREWIAGVETRLEESVRTAEDQVKLMGALMDNKNDTSRSSSDNHATSRDMKEMVARLAHQGWKADAIARTTKLSRGAVELILELPRINNSKNRD